MSGIQCHELNEENAYSGIVEAGGFAFLPFCVGNVGGTPSEQVEDALDDMEARLPKALQGHLPGSQGDPDGILPPRRQGRAKLQIDAIACCVAWRRRRK